MLTPPIVPKRAMDEDLLTFLLLLACSVLFIGFTVAQFQNNEFDLGAAARAPETFLDENL